MKNERSRSAFTLVEVLVVISIVGLVIAIIYGNAHRDEIKQQNEAQHKMALLPPGVTDANAYPVPIQLESHVGQDWIIARGNSTIKYGIVIYYPREIRLVSVRHVPAEMSGQPGQQMTGMEYLEVTAAYEPSPSYEGTSATECFMLGPYNATPSIFLGLTDRDLFYHLKMQVTKLEY